MTPLEVLDSYPAHDYTLPSILAGRAATAPERDALQFEARSWTYRELLDGSELLARRLYELGVRRGDFVSHAAPNSDLAVLLFQSLGRLGATFVPLNIELSDDDLSYMIGKSGAVMVVCATADEARIDRLTAAIDSKISRLALDDVGAQLASAAAVIECLKAQINLSSMIELPTPNSDDPCFVIFTSGTTGFPKGVLHSHRTYILSAEAFVERMHLQPSDRLLSVFPLFHGNAMFYTIGGALAAGGCAITAKKFSASGFWKLAVDSRATQLNILAALGNILMLRPRSEFDPRHQLRKVYGGPISDEMYRVFREEFNIPILLEGYGMSEIPATCCNPITGVQKPGTIGLPCRHPRFPGAFSEVRIVDDEGRPLPQGAVGELVVRTPTMFQGYLNDPERTAETFRDGWFLTGDLASIDEDGYVKFNSRKKDIIRVKGENISGAELDRILSTHPDVDEAAVIAVPAALGEDEILAAFVLRPGRTVDCETLLEWSRGYLAPLKVPRYWVIVDALPHTPTHRVAKHEMKKDKTLRERAVDAETLGASA